MGAPAPGNGCYDTPRSRGVGSPGVTWHRKVPPSGLWLCGSASTWQWRAQNTSTFHATPPRTVLHAPTHTITLVRRHNVYAAAMSTGGATMVSSWYVDTSGLRAMESLFSHFPLCTMFLKPRYSTRLSTTLPLSGSSTARTRIRPRAFHFSWT